MRIVMAVILAGGMALAGCSDQTQQNAEEAAKSAASDVASNTSEVLSEGATAVDKAVDKATDKLDKDGDTKTTSLANVNGGSTTTKTD